MTTSPLLAGLQQRAFGIALFAAIVLIIVQAVMDGSGMLQNFAEQGNDDILRLVMVRDWLAGQGWFDTTQYRLVPPDGVVIHWSRYIDAGIAALIVPLSVFMPMGQAELIAVAIWPTLIMIITLTLVAFGTRHIFGTVAACFAILCFTFWPVTGDLHSGAGNLDHHNVQLLMMVLLAFGLIWPDRPVAAGVVGGLAGAFSLAIGLESLPFIVIGGLGFVIRALFLDTTIGPRLLTSFCAALGLGSIILFLGQTAPSRWAAPVCDQLGTPTLALIGVAIAASLLPFVMRRTGISPWLHLSITVALTAVGIIAIWPLLAGCLEGPYSDLTPELQEMITSRIIEARPGLTYAQTHTGPFIIFTLPVFTALIAGAVLWSRAGPETLTQETRRALGLLLMLCLLGTAMLLVQMRTVIMVAAVVPVIGGCVATALLQGYLRRRDAVQGLLGLLVATAMISPTSVAQPFSALLVREQSASREAAADCRNLASLESLNAVAPGVILAPMNFGSPMLFATHHAVLAAPYHRSPEALKNGILPFEMTEEELRDYIGQTGATHLLLCRGATYRGSFAQHLVEGGNADWLQPVRVADDGQMLFALTQ
ncbi:MAG: hypothetical protein AAFU41_10290 [Pseudomonadota bacterium]